MSCSSLHVASQRFVGFVRNVIELASGSWSSLEFKGNVRILLTRAGFLRRSIAFGNGCRGVKKMHRIGFELSESAHIQAAVFDSEPRKCLDNN